MTSTKITTRPFLAKTDRLAIGKLFQLPVSVDTSASRSIEGYSSACCVALIAPVQSSQHLETESAPAP